MCRKSTSIWQYCNAQVVSLFEVLGFWIVYLEVPSWLRPFHQSHIIWLDIRHQNCRFLSPKIQQKVPNIKTATLENCGSNLSKDIHYSLRKTKTDLSICVRYFRRPIRSLPRRGYHRHHLASVFWWYLHLVFYFFSLFRQKNICFEMFLEVKERLYHKL